MSQEKSDNENINEVFYKSPPENTTKNKIKQKQVKPNITKQNKTKQNKTKQSKTNKQQQQQQSQKSSTLSALAPLLLTASVVRLGRNRIGTLTSKHKILAESKENHIAYENNNMKV